MKDFIKNPLNLNKIEFWAVTTMFVFAIFSLVAKAGDANIDSQWTSNKWGFEEFKTPYFFYINYFFPQVSRIVILYGSFLFLNFYIAPRIIKRQADFKNIFLIIASILIFGFVWGTSETYLNAFLLLKYKTLEEGYEQIFQSSYAYTFWLFFMFILYSVIKFVAQYLLVNSELIQSKYQIVSREGLIAFVLWMISTFLLLINSADSVVVMVWSVIIVVGICLYWYSFYELIPAALKKKKPFINYLSRIFFIAVLAVLPIMFIASLTFQNGQSGVMVNLFNIGFQLLITAPLSWVVYKRRMADDQELYTLKTELGRSNANLDFLRSQINPHFLFNALNTLYGTALHESADRTGEGIQKLGDMMRFMLQENVQDKISLTREVEYLNNYISLQRLRTDISPDIIIQAEIEEQVGNLRISPMMLIPFVENAFKHGISMREPSHIKITLQTKENTLYFDVYNSIHARPDNDPEKNINGIGLENVKQRLNLQYRHKHELIIRETAKEFFIHLTLQLS